MHKRILKSLSILVSVALFMSLIATSVIAQAQSDTDSSTTNSQTDDTTKDTTDSDTTSIDPTGERHPDCLRIKTRIDEIEAKIRTNANTATEDEMARFKLELAEQKDKLMRCVKDHELNREEVRDQTEERTSDESDELKDRLENVVENCKECAELRLRLHEANQKAEEMWENLSRVRAALKKASEEQSADPTNEELIAKLKDLKEKAQKIHQSWEEFNDKKAAAKAALEKCIETIKEQCTDLMPHVRDEIMSRSDDSLFHDHAAAAIMVQWGNISEPNRDQERSEWEINANIDDGKMKVRKEILFEDNDQVIDTESEDSIAAKSFIKGHWDGLLLQVMPGAKASEVSLHVGDFHKVYRAEELYGLHEVHKLDNGMEVVINSTVRGLEISKEKYEGLIDRKEKVSEKLHEIDGKLRDLNDKDKVSDKARERYKKFRQQVEEYLVPEGGEVDFTDLLEKCRQNLDDDVADDDDITDCEEKLMKVRLLHRAKKFNEGLIPFPDVDDNDWFVEFVRYAKENKIVGGFEDGTFGPGKNATRAELLKMAMEASGEDLNEEGDDNPEDSRDHWAKKYIAKGLMKKIVSGYEDGKEFRPNAQVTRAEAVKIIFNALGIQVPDCDDTSFADTKGHWAKCVVKHAADLGIVDGNPDGSFAPDRPITRAAIAKIIKNAVEYARSQEGGSTGRDISAEEMKEIEDEIFGESEHSETETEIENETETEPTETEEVAS